jgi:hypothetical protein
MYLLLYVSFSLNSFLSFDFINTYSFLYRVSLMPYICIYINIYMCIYTCIHIYIYVYVYIHIYTHIGCPRCHQRGSGDRHLPSDRGGCVLYRLPPHLRRWFEPQGSGTYMYMYIFIYVYIYIYIFIYIYMYIYIYIYIYTYIYIYIHKYIYRNSLLVCVFL